MNQDLNWWIELAIRWTHVFAGIMWVGATYYFTWLDGRFVELEARAKKNPDDKNPEKLVWMVHSGGVYLVEEGKNPRVVSPTLHWSKWEAVTFCIRGFLLFRLMYSRGDRLVIFGDALFRLEAAIWLTVGMIRAAWLFYALLCKFCRNDIPGII